jgi:hypothetical protein
MAYLVTVVGCREDGDAPPVMLHLIPLLLDLMTPHKQLQPVLVQEVLGHIRACTSKASRTFVDTLQESCKLQVCIL